MKSRLNRPTSLIALLPRQQSVHIHFRKSQSLHVFKKNLAPLWEDMSLELGKARFGRRPTHAPNLTNQLRTAKERLLVLGAAKVRQSVALLSNLT